MAVTVSRGLRDKLSGHLPQPLRLARVPRPTGDSAAEHLGLPAQHRRLIAVLEVAAAHPGQKPPRPAAGWPRREQDIGGLGLPVGRPRVVWPVPEVEILEDHPREHVRIGADADDPAPPAAASDACSPAVSAKCPRKFVAPPARRAYQKRPRTRMIRCRRERHSATSNTRLYWEYEDRDFSAGGHFRAGH